MTINIKYNTLGETLRTGWPLMATAWYFSHGYTCQKIILQAYIHDNRLQMTSAISKRNVLYTV